MLAEGKHAVSLNRPSGRSARITLVDADIVQLHASCTLRHIECDTRGRIGITDRHGMRELFEARIDRHLPLPIGNIGIAVRSGIEVSRHHPRASRGASAIAKRILLICD